MHKCFNLPCDSRTLLQTPLTVPVESVSPGLYSHIGLEYNLIKLWSKVTEVVDSIHLMIGIDGLPLFTSSSQSFWPIMGFVNNVKQIKSIVFPIGIFFGKKKPDNCPSFLKAFVTEAVNFVHNGIVLKGKVMKVVIQGFWVLHSLKKTASSHSNKPAAFSSSQTIVNGKLVAWMADISLKVQQLQGKMGVILENQEKNTVAASSPRAKKR
ncbi:hypothetical protein AVEN_16450-1 [Araneus ventricosus]|uniref:Uncharacterized protein n=1 Tax=Araneus ventricosus TaxID=182803 RepID=A0A4Y2IRN5_ARAVE|nr:hypothetical protein AVEN_16450-1 [Araneus ventricosus]